MATPDPDPNAPKPLPASGTGRIYFDVPLPGVPWYVYHDRFDAYGVCTRSSESTLTLDISVSDPAGATGQDPALVIGSAKIPLSLSPRLRGSDPDPNPNHDPNPNANPDPGQATENTTTEFGEKKVPVSDAKWTPLAGLKGWHRSPGSGVAQFVQTVGHVHPATYYRSVLVEAEYSLAPVRNSVDTLAERYDLSVRVSSVIGEGGRDDSSEATGRGRVARGSGEGQGEKQGAAAAGVFQLSVARDGRDGPGWHVVATEGVDMQDGVVTTAW